MNCKTIIDFAWVANWPNWLSMDAKKDHFTLSNPDKTSMTCFYY